MLKRCGNTLANGRCGNLTELMQAAKFTGWDQAFVDFIAEFRAHPTIGALEDPPVLLLGYHRALMGAVVETLATEQGWMPPVWTQNPLCFMEVPHLGLPDRLRHALSLEDQAALLVVLSPDCPPIFKKHGIIVKWNLMATK